MQVSMNQMMEMVSSFDGRSLPIRHIPGPEGVRGRNSDNSLILEKLGWEPTVRLGHGLRITYGWIKGELAKVGSLIASDLCMWSCQLVVAVLQAASRRSKYCDMAVTQSASGGWSCIRLEVCLVQHHAGIPAASEWNVFGHCYHPFERSEAAAMASPVDALVMFGWSTRSMFIIRVAAVHMRPAIRPVNFNPHSLAKAPAGLCCVPAHNALLSDRLF